MFGCDNYSGPYEHGRAYDDLAKKSLNNCNKPTAFGLIAVLYFVSFCVNGAQVLLTLFIGIIATSMEEAKTKFKAEAALDKRIEERARQMFASDAESKSGSTSYHSSSGKVALEIKQFKRDMLPYYKKIYDFLDDGGDGKISRDEFKPLVPVLAVVRKVLVNLTMM